MTDPRTHRTFWIPTLLTLVMSAALGAAALQAQDSELVVQLDRRPKLFVTDFSWYTPNRDSRGRLSQRGLACTRAKPRAAQGELTGTDYLSSGGYYGRKYDRLRAHGVDGVAFVVTDRVPDSFEGSNLEVLAGQAVEARIDFFAYYDLFVTTARESKLVLCPFPPCSVNSGQRRVINFDLARDGAFAEQLRRDFRDIAETLILPYMDPQRAGGYAFLEDANGHRVLDEIGLPRPILGIYIAREFADRPRNADALRAWLEELTATYRGFGIGRPAFMLDMIFWGTRTEDNVNASYDPDIVEVFGQNAVALTWYSFFDNFRARGFRISNDGPQPPMQQWAQRIHQRYRQTRRELIANRQPLMIWPGVTSQIDTRRADLPGCATRDIEVIYNLRGVADWRRMLRSGYNNTWRPIIEGDTPLQTLVVVSNAGEWFEAGGIDHTAPDRSGRCSYPYNWCNALLEEMRAADRF